MRKKTFYRSCKSYTTEANVIVNNYIQGYYFNKETNLKEVIPEGVNKYNKQFLCELSDLNMQFYGTILTFGTIIQIIKEHEELCYGDINNLYRLMHAQSGTIKFNKTLRSSLRRYRIVNKKIYDAMIYGIKIQKDRIARNRKLLERLLVDYGMQDILKLIEDSTGLNLFDHTVKFVDEAMAEALILSDEDEENVREKAESDYVKYLEKLASDNKISLYDTVTDALRKKIETGNEMHEKIVANNKLYKEEQLHKKRVNALHNDNITLQSEINCLVDIMECEVVGKKFTKTGAALMHTRIRDKNGAIYYIALIKLAGVKYVGDKKTVVNSMARAKLFSDVKSAQEHLDSISKELEGYYAEVMKLIIVKPKADESSVNLASYVESIIEAPSTFEERLMCKKIVETALGVEGTGSSGEAYIYACDDPDITRGILCETLRGEVVLGYIGYSMVVRPIQEKYSTDIHMRFDNRDLCFKHKKIKFNCGIYHDSLVELARYDKYIRNRLNNYVENECDDTEVDSARSFSRIKKKVDELTQGCDKIYYVLGVSIHSNNNKAYCRGSNVDNITMTIGTMDLFTSYERAVRICRLLSEQRYTKRYVWRVFDITEKV